MVKYIFIDIDGVLNPGILRDGGFRHLGLPFGASAPGFYLNLHRDYATWLTNLAENTGSSLVWGSTWQEHANEWVGKPLGLPYIPHLDLSDRKFSENLGSIKARTAVKYAKGNKFVYFDDEPNIGYCIEDYPNGHHVHVDYNSGLTMDHIQEAESFLME